MEITPLEKTNILVEALPYVNRFKDKIIVIKYGGNAMIDNELKDCVMQDIHLMKSVGLHPILVHGGGPAINDMLGRLNIESEFVEGMRRTDEEVMTVVEMVLTGHVNKEIVGRLNSVGAQAIGLSGKDGHLLRAKKKYLSKVNEHGEEELIDIGFVGRVDSVNVDLLHKLIESGYIPVISSVGMGDNGESYNINADYVAGAIARALRADKFVLLTDVEGVLRDYHDKTSLIQRLNEAKIEDLKEEGIISGGMIPKVDCCLYAINGGVRQAHIIDGRLKHSLLLEIFSDKGIGTMISKH